MWSSEKTFREEGFAIVPADNREALDKLRDEIFQRARRIFGHQQNDPTEFFNQFHKLAISGAQLNDLRMKLIREVTDEVDSGTLIFDAFRGTILELLGPDLLVQKNTNLVIQQPNDPNPSELHRDAPGNSAFEIVVWLPLVDTYGTKAMYVANRGMTDHALQLLDETVEGYNKFQDYVKTEAPAVSVPYGQGLFFWPGLLHGSHVNTEPETRWSLNLRYKNVFSPNGDKEPFEFFKVFRLSPLAELGAEFQRQKDLA